MIRKKTTNDLVGERPTPDELTKLPRIPISIVADNVRSLDNVGLLFRLCELARIEKLYLTGYTGYPRATRDRRSEHTIARHVRRIEKTAVYAVPHQPWEHVDDPVPLVRKLKKSNHRIIALEQTDQSIPYHKLKAISYKLPAAMLIGHERNGVRDELLKLADAIIDIPILGLGNSHNVAIATGIVLYRILETTKQLDSISI